MKANRDIREIVADLDTIICEVSKLDAIDRLIGRKSWYDYDGFVEKLKGILNGEEERDEISDAL